MNGQTGYERFVLVQDVQSHCCLLCSVEPGWFSQLNMNDVLELCCLWSADIVNFSNWTRVEVAECIGQNEDDEEAGPFPWLWSP